MKVGDYVRTDTQGIWELEFIRTQAKKYTHHLIKQYDSITIFRNVEEKRIVKSSSSIIDLIQVGDYVNGMEVTRICFDEDGEKVLNLSNCILELMNEDIKSIVTKEQFEVVKYTINK